RHGVRREGQVAGHLGDGELDRRIAVALLAAGRRQRRDRLDRSGLGPGGRPAPGRLRPAYRWLCGQLTDQCLLTERRLRLVDLDRHVRPLVSIARTPIAGAATAAA